MKLKFIKTGLLDTVQDGGRVGYRKFGVPVSGFMDEAAAHQANILVGNDQDAPLFELTITGPTIEFQGRGYVAFTGADMKAKLNEQTVDRYKSFAVKKGDKLAFKAAERGSRAYLAIQGSLQTQPYFDSKSTLYYAGMGQVIQKGEVFEILNANPLKPKAKQVKPPYFPKGITLRVLPGPEYDLLDDQQWAVLESQGYKVSAQSNRMGVRLKGDRKLKLKKQSQILSSPILKGTVQLPQSGLPLIFMADAPTSGGYPRIAQVIKADLDQLGQLQPGNVVRVKRTDIKTALNAYPHF